MTNFPNLIREWYLQNGRDLPWRDTTDPYKIWIAEIILQQTQVKQGINYYHDFLEKFPNVSVLAKASENQVMGQWQGLGYYSRARNIHHAAKTIVKEHGALIPRTYKKIKNLKGIGPYTAAAIASFAFGLPHAVIDGNVYRLLSRFFEINLPIDTTEGKKYFEKLAEELLDRDDPATHNQAMMELGAIVCKPATPLCNKCPLNQTCKAFSSETQANYPVKIKKNSRKKRYLNFFIIHCKNNHLVVQKRTGKDIWQGLYQLPLIETEEKATSKTIVNAFVTMTGVHDAKISKQFEKKHLLTHQELHTTFYKVTWPKHQKIADSFDNIRNKIITYHDAENLPFPQLIKANLKNIL